MTNHKPFVSIESAARSLGVPLAWLRRLADSGAIPAVRAGRRWLVPLDLTRERLVELAKRREVPQ
ncbi:MAG: helix-turn-helix domain-containing protein [Phycisphaerales bacterium]